MSERWRRPANVVAIEEHPTLGIWLPDGRVQGQVRIAVDDETAERIRTGYMCAKCLEPFEFAWPVRCNVCGAPIRERQAEYLAQQFGVEEPVSRPSWDEERAAIPEHIAKEEEERRAP